VIGGAWWMVRIQADAEEGKAKSVSGYLEELMPEEEVLEHSFDEMFARLDAQIARDEARKQ
jgi:hypothetical protein